MMAKKIEDGGPAFAHGNPEQGGDPGMTLRQYAAIKLRVPNSGTEWLDEMIREARRLDLAGQSLPAIIRAEDDKVWTRTGPHDACAQQAYMYADAMLRARTTDGDAS